MNAYSLYIVYKLRTGNNHFYIAKLGSVDQMHIQLSALRALMAYWQFINKRTRFPRPILLRSEYNRNGRGIGNRIMRVGLLCCRSVYVRWACACACAQWLSAGD